DGYCLTAATLNSSVNRALLINVSLRRYYEAKMCLVNLGRFRFQGRNSKNSLDYGPILFFIPPSVRYNRGSCYVRYFVCTSLFGKAGKLLLLLQLVISIIKGSSLINLSDAS